ncbi:hypothetical protein [Hymenobacter volaticus]|uniref:CBS domain-containing protein n=1 Tax=Hymenobacter volaticus TaxID=2932254 RepID=A0ABY4G4D2_9BACT|nr:hypothetical protein [Hymenobacter volaticus]UOQ65721.1 hypothetical protein MUN86_19660 [Hymenobacter volaticus]
MEAVVPSPAAPLNGKKHPNGNAVIGTVTIAELQALTTQDATAHIQPSVIVPHKNVLATLLKQVQKLDFRKIVGLDNETEKLKQKHYVVTVVEEALALAARNHWGYAET